MDWRKLSPGITSRVNQNFTIAVCVFIVKNWKCAAKRVVGTPQRWTYTAKKNSTDCKNDRKN